MASPRPNLRLNEKGTTHRPSTWRPRTGVQVVGDLYDGAFGRTLAIELRSVEAVRWLRAVLLEVAENGEAIDLARLQPVWLAGVSQLELRLAKKPPTKHLRLAGDDALVWTCTSEEWHTVADLIDALSVGRGFQYLTEEGYDDVLVEVSLGQAHRT